MPGNTGAQEVDLVFRHALDIGKVMGSPIQFGPVRGVGFTAGFDPNTRTDGYASKKRMLVLGATLMFDVPGQLDASRLLFFESRAHPKSRTPR